MPGPVFNAELQRKPNAEIVMIGLAAVGIGILVGIWVAGPAMTGSGTQTVASDPIMRWVPPTYGEMSRPDLAPNRTASSSFDSRGPIGYAGAARAQAETSGQGSRDDWDRPISERQSGRAPRSAASDRPSDIH